MLRVATFNVNGIRAATRRGFRPWLERTNPDVVCLQEVRAGARHIPEGVFDGYVLSYDEGNRPGRAGVAVLSRVAPTALRCGLGDPEFDLQGRYLEVDLPGVTVASLYLPKGAADGPLLANKLRFLSVLGDHLTRTGDRIAAADSEYVICGDFNIAPTALDLKSWKTNQHSPGFLPVERQWITETPAAAGLVDVLRRLHPDREGPYTWWSWRGRQFDNDAGWRIDHHYATRRLADSAVAGWVDREESYELRKSDHSPVVVDYALPPPLSPLW